MQNFGFKRDYQRFMDKQWNCINKALGFTMYINIQTESADGLKPEFITPISFVFASVTPRHKTCDEFYIEFLLNYIDWEGCY